MIYKYDNWDLTIAEFTCKNIYIFVYKYKCIAIGDPVIKRGGLEFPEYIGGAMKLQLHQSGFITLKFIITPIIENI